MRSKRYSRVPIPNTAVWFCWIVTLPVFAASCTTPRPASVHRAPVTPLPAAVATKLVETPYAIRGYREAAHASVRHEPHMIFRSARVPISAADELATVPRTSYPPASISPLPISAELAAEISTQKKVTEDLHRLKSSMAQAESRMQEQYALLIRQSSEVTKVRQQLEEEREKFRAATSAAAPATAEGARTARSTEAKW